MCAIVATGVFVDSGPSFRKQLYGEYKAHRAAPSAVRLSHYSRPSFTCQ
jgi:5'-3' exonuclease